MRGAPGSPGYSRTSARHPYGPRKECVHRIGNEDAIPEVLAHVHQGQGATPLPIHCISGWRRSVCPIRKYEPAGKWVKGTSYPHAPHRVELIRTRCSGSSKGAGRGFGDCWRMQRGWEMTIETTIRNGLPVLASGRMCRAEPDVGIMSQVRRGLVCLFPERPSGPLRAVRRGRSAARSRACAGQRAAV